MTFAFGGKETEREKEAGWAGRRGEGVCERGETGQGGGPCPWQGDTPRGPLSIPQP